MLLLDNIGQLLTLRGTAGPRAGKAMSELGIVSNARLAIDDDGNIGWLGPRDHAVPARWKQAPGRDCAGGVVMPAFVDAHTHLVWGGHRRDELEMRLAGADYEAIFAAGGGILASVRHTRATSEDELYRQARQRIARMRRAGTTTFEIKSGYGLELETELRQLRVARRLARDGFRIKSTCLAAHALPPEVRDDPAARSRFIAEIRDQILPAVAREGLAEFCDVFCERGVFTPNEARTILERARELGLKPRIHANEFGSTGGAALAAELHAASADHLLHLDRGEREALREAGVVATLLPGTSLVLGKPYADGRALVDAGVPIAVASDCNPGSCALENLAVVLGLACYGNRLSPAEAICATTHNAAASLRLDHVVGSLVPGHAADLLVLETGDYRDLVYHAGSPLVRQVYQQGQIVAS